MKQQLHYLFFLAFSLSFAQAPINQFANGTQTDYAIVNSSTAIDESVTGANLTWNFTNLSQVGTNTDTNTAPTAGEISDYPGTTEVLTITTAGMPPVESKLFISNQGGVVSLTGAEQGGQLSLELTNNATLGTFPLSYSYANLDTVSGNFDALVNGTPASGTFAGDFDTEVDAYGTLNLNDFGLGSYSGSVTRLKTELEIDLFIFTVVNIGSIVQTNYYYYDDADGSLVFRSSTNVVDISFAGNDFMDTISLYEAQDRSTLSNSESLLANDEFKLFPNPTNDILNIKSPEDTTLTSIRIVDLNGRTVLQLNDDFNAIDVSNFQSGFYLVNVETDSGNISKRFIKQ